jgi:hypothetical protein
MSGLAEGLGLWALGGLVWWAAALAAALPYRFRHRAWLSWARLTVGLPLTVAAWLEVSRSRHHRSGRRPSPYRGFAPLVLSAAVAEVFALVAGGVVAAARWLSG